MNRKILQRFCFLVLAMALFIGLNVDLLAAAGHEYPSKIITLINAYTPGGGIDIAYRPILDVLPDYLGQKIIMSHHPGAGGAIGAAFAAKAKPDGYTLFAGGTGAINLIPATRKVPYSFDDFVPLGLFAKAIDVLCVKSDAPWKTLQELIADAKKNPGKYKFSTYGHMSAPHFCMELLNRAAVIKTGHIPYTNDTLALTATMGGHTAIAVATVQAALPHIQSGALRALVVSDTTRYKFLPDVPTFKELGYDIRVIIWFGLLAPKGTPKEIVDKLYRAQKKAFEDNKLQPIIENIGILPFLTTPEEMDKIVREDQALYTRAAKEFGFEVK